MKSEHNEQQIMHNNYLTIISFQPYFAKVTFLSRLFTAVSTPSVNLATAVKFFMDPAFCFG